MSQDTNALEALERVESLSERAYVQLREKIATGAFKPGERLTERGLAVLLGVSPTPVREALRRLQQERLITRPSGRVLAVVDHSEETISELLYAEALLRGAIARFATWKVTDEEIDDLERVLDELERQADQGTPEDIQAVASRFDTILDEAAANPSLDALVASVGVFGHARRLRLIEHLRDEEALGRERLQAHRDIVAALRARDAELVEELTRQQLMTSHELMLQRDLD